MEQELKCFIDGDHLCIVEDDFANLQQSKAVFVKITKQQDNELKDIIKLNIENMEDLKEENIPDYGSIDL